LNINVIRVVLRFSGTERVTKKTTIELATSIDHQLYWDWVRCITLGGKFGHGSLQSSHNNPSIIYSVNLSIPKDPVAFSELTRYTLYFFHFLHL